MDKSIKTVDGQTRLVVGILVLGSIALAQFVNPAWIYFTVFIGFALIVAGFTGVCPMEFFVSRCPWNHKKTPSTPIGQKP